MLVLGLGCWHWFFQARHSSYFGAGHELAAAAVSIFIISPLWHYHSEWTKPPPLQLNWNDCYCVRIFQNQGTVGAPSQNPQKSPICWQSGRRFWVWARINLKYAPPSPPTQTLTDRETEDFHVRSRVQRMWQKLSQFPITFCPFGFSAAGNFSGPSKVCLVINLLILIRLIWPDTWNPFETTESHGWCSGRFV